MVQELADWAVRTRCLPTTKPLTSNLLGCFLQDHFWSSLRLRGMSPYTTHSYATAWSFGLASRRQNARLKSAIGIHKTLLRCSQPPDI